jgi:hypothetical protein
MVFSFSEVHYLTGIESRAIEQDITKTISGNLTHHLANFFNAS